MHHFVIALARRHQRPDIRPRVDDDMGEARALGRQQAVDVPPAIYAPALLKALSGKPPVTNFVATCARRPASDSGRRSIAAFIEPSRTYLGGLARWLWRARRRSPPSSRRPDATSSPSSGDGSIHDEHTGVATYAATA